MKETGNLIVDLTFQYSLDIVKFTDKLEQMKKFTIATQLTKSGTSIGVNIRESQSSESTEDFVHKLKLSEKELEETEYWLDICKYSDCLLDPGGSRKNHCNVQKKHQLEKKGSSIAFSHLHICRSSHRKSDNFVYTRNHSFEKSFNSGFECNTR